ncbi:MAG TPA: hypothetical protein VJN50_08365 [Actinomycetota bacterium]|nr:hypothetical protein [Actinomycetota bacterium]
MFDWTYLDDDGNELGRSQRFSDVDSAEDWIGSSWKDLADTGVEEVVLYDRQRDRKIYRMGLRAE